MNQESDRLAWRNNQLHETLNSLLQILKVNVRIMLLSVPNVKRYLILI